MHMPKGRKSKYETHVLPKLEEIKRWYLKDTEKTICKKLGVSLKSWIGYKREHPELMDALTNSKDTLIKEVKESMKERAKGFYYKEKKVTETVDADGNKMVKREIFEKYALPDVTAQHILLKNLDPNWHNDDMETIRQKRKQLEQTDRRIDNQEW